MIALQEVNLQKNTAYWLADRLGYEYIYLSPKTGKDAEIEAIGILSRFPFERQETLDLQTQNRVAQLVQVSVEDRRLVVVNGHFYWQPGESEERLQQVKLLLDWLETTAQGLPLVICGDFNSTPESASIQLMKQRFTSAYSARHGEEPVYTFPTPLRVPRPRLFRTVFSFRGKFPQVWYGTLDYIFVSQDLRVLDSQLALTRSDPKHPWLHPSDHFGLGVELEFDM